MSDVPAGRARVSVIIPAHNEADVVAGCLRAVTASTIADELEVIVVCNGCTDDTASVAQSVSDRIRVLESPIAAKHAALNLGDQKATASLRVYLDADTIVSAGAIEAVAALLEPRGVLAASPEVNFDLRHCSWPARQFHNVWRHSPYFTGTTLGAGFYAISEQGRCRFDAFPPVVGDDYFVSCLFAEHERRTAVGHTYTPLLPTTLRSMLTVHLRHYGAHAEFDEWWREHGRGELSGRPRSDYRWLATIARRPARWAGIVLYVALKVVSIPLGRHKHRRQGMAKWNRDEAGRRATRN